MGSARTSARGAAEATQDATVEAGASPARGRDDETIAVEAEPRWGRWIVADDADAGPGQIRHGVLFATLRRDLYRACDAELLRVGRTAMDCLMLAAFAGHGRDSRQSLAHKFLAQLFSEAGSREGSPAGWGMPMPGTMRGTPMAEAMEVMVRIAHPDSAGVLLQSIVSFQSAPSAPPAGKEAKQVLPQQ